MIGLDTNVIIRYLVQDDPRQSKIVNSHFEKWIKNGETLWICQTTLCEIFWVLESCYKLEKADVINILKQLLQTRHIQVERDDVAWKSLKDYENSTKADFSDCLIGRQNAHYECETTYSFDKNAAKSLPTFKLLT